MKAAGCWLSVCHVKTVLRLSQLRDPWVPAVTNVTGSHHHRSPSDETQAVTLIGPSHHTSLKALQDANEHFRRTSKGLIHLFPILLLLNSNWNYYFKMFCSLKPDRDKTWLSRAFKKYNIVSAFTVIRQHFSIDVCIFILCTLTFCEFHFRSHISVDIKIDLLTEKEIKKKKVKHLSSHFSSDRLLRGPISKQRACLPLP